MCLESKEGVGSWPYWVFHFSFWSFIKKQPKNSLDWVHWLNLTSNQFQEGYRPDVGWFGLEVIPALVHVIQPVLQEGGFFGAAQGFDHLWLVAVHALVDVIVGIDLCLDVLENRRQRRNLRFFSRWGYWAWTSSAEMLVHIKITPDWTFLWAFEGDESWGAVLTGCETNCTKHFWRPEQLKFVFFGPFFWLVCYDDHFTLEETLKSLECTGVLRLVSL